MDFSVVPSAISGGSITVPGDKSISHRALMLGAIAKGQSVITGLLVGEDCLATLAALTDLGVSVERADETTVIVRGRGSEGFDQPSQSLDLGNSGTAMRLFAGLLAGQGLNVTLTGDESLSRRPMRRVIEPLKSMGAILESDDGTPPLRILPTAALTGITYRMPVASAQVKSALLLAGLHAQGETHITELAITRDHTERMLRQMGAKVVSSDKKISMPGPQRLNAADVEVPGDLSSAAFPLLAAILAEDAELRVEGVGVNPTRVGVIEILREMGADIRIDNPRLHGEEPVADLIARSSRLSGITVSADRVSLAIDEFPALFVAAAAADGISRFHGLEELRVKESDRVATMVKGLRSLGVGATETDSGAEILGGPLSGGRVDSYGDHRVAMAFAVAAARAADRVDVSDVAAVATSFPGFAETMRTIGLGIAERGAAA